LIDLLQESDSAFLHTLDANSRLPAAAQSAAALSVNEPALLDWPSLLQLAVIAVAHEKGSSSSKAKSESADSRAGSAIAESWSYLRWLFSSSERHGQHFLNKQVIEAMMEQIRRILKGEVATKKGGGVSSAAPVSSTMIKSSIGALVAIMDLIFSYAPYAQLVKQDHYHGKYSAADDGSVGCHW